MKKHFLVFCIATMLLSSIACNTKPTSTQEEQPSTQSQETPESTAIPFDELVVADTENYVFKITNIDFSGEDNRKIYVDFENKNQRRYSISISDISVNGLQDHVTAWGAFIDSKKTYKDIIHLFRGIEDAPDSFGPDDLYTNTELTDIKITFTVSDWRDDTDTDYTVRLYPHGEENTITFSREQQSTDYILLDNEYVTIFVTGYEKTKRTNDTIQLFMTNKTEHPLYFSIDPLYINDKRCSSLLQGAITLQIDAQCHSFNTLSLDYVMRVKKIKTLEKINFQIHAYNPKNMDTTLFEKNITLIPPEIN